MTVFAGFVPGAGGGFRQRAGGLGMKPADQLHRLCPHRPLHPRQNNLQRHIQSLRPVGHPQQQMEMVVPEAAERQWLAAGQTAPCCPQGGMAVGRLFHDYVSTSTFSKSSSARIVFIINSLESELGQYCRLGIPESVCQTPAPES